jgi:hypothetical protein
MVYEINISPKWKFSKTCPRFNVHSFHVNQNIFMLIIEISFGYFFEFFCILDVYFMFLNRLFWKLHLVIFHDHKFAWSWITSYFMFPCCTLEPCIKYSKKSFKWLNSPIIWIISKNVNLKRNDYFQIICIIDSIILFIAKVIIMLTITYGNQFNAWYLMIFKILLVPVVISKRTNLSHIDGTC